MRVLFIVSSRYWITAEEVYQILKHNHQVEGVICSVPLLDELLERVPSLLDKIDIVHFMVPVAGRRYLDQFRGKIPCVATIYHIEPGYAPEAVSVNAKADSVMIISEMWRSELIERGVPAQKIFLMPNGVDTNIFRPPLEAERAQLRKYMGFTSDEIVIGFSGQPGRDNGWRKGLDVFIDALKLLLQKGKSIAVVVGGPGWAKALEQIRALGVKAYQRPYVLDVENGAPMYRALDFFWVTSRIEGGPAPLVEAMSSGVCCISTRVGIAPEIIKDGVNGCLVNIEDSAQIAFLTNELISNVENRLRMGREARTTIVAEHDWSKTTKRVLSLYDAARINFERQYALADKPRRENNPVSHVGSLPSPDAAWLDAQERLIWSRELCRMGERRAAFSLGWRACLAYPFSMRTWSFLVNLLLPARTLGQRQVTKV